MLNQLVTCFIECALLPGSRVPARQRGRGERRGSNAESLVACRNRNSPELRIAILPHIYSFIPLFLFLFGKKLVQSFHSPSAHPLQCVTPPVTNTPLPFHFMCKKNLVTTLHYHM